MGQKKWFYKLFLSVLGLMMLVGLFNLQAPAFAGEPAALTVKGDGVATEKTFTLEQLQAMEQYRHVYSAINTWPTKKWYVGEGVKLIDLLNEAGIKEEATLIKFTSGDGFNVTLTVKEAVYTNRYYFPGLKDNHEYFGYIPGSAAGAEKVEAILALFSAEGTDDPAAMNDSGALLLMLGQRAVTEQSGSLFVKNVVEIEVLTKAPEKWDKPLAEPAGGEVAPGTSVTLTSALMDEDKIYYTTDGSTPTVNSPMYNWIASRWWSSREDELDSINQPVKITRNTIIKAITIGPGKYDSDIVTFSYQVPVVAPPLLTADVTENVAGSAIELTFTDDPAWRAAVTGVTVNGTPLAAGEYILEESKLTIIGEIFKQAGDYPISVQATGYADAVVTQTIKSDSSGGGPTIPDGDVVLTITGDGVKTTKKFTQAQLEAMEQYRQVYSAINTWPTKKWYIGEGVKLRDLLDAAGIKGSAQQIRFTSGDSFSVTLTVEELLKNKRYYYPNLKDNDPNLGHIPGSASGAKQVEPILALVSADGTDESRYMNDTDALLLMLGQRAVTEQTGQLFVKNVEEIEVLTDEPDQWDEPEADPASGQVTPGTLVTLSSKKNDDDKVYYTTDGSTPTVNSTMYNWIASRWWSSREDELDSINQPIEITRDTTIKAVVIGPGREDSDVVTFTYQVAEEPGASSTISPGTGGTVSFGSEASIEIPAGALKDADAEVEIHKVSVPPAAPAGYKIIGSVFEFRVDGKKNYSFKKNVSIKLSFAPGAVTPGENPAIYYYDEDLGEWVNIGGDISGNTVTVQVDHFTKFAVMVAVKEPALTDITGHWAFDSINRLLAMGCISGYPDGTFRPDNTITRAEFVTVLVKAFGLASKEGKSFADTAGHWAEDCIATATAWGLVNGYDETTFGPEDLVTREQIAVMIVKAAKIPPAAGSPSFADSAGISAWAAAAVNTAAIKGIMRGYPDNTFRPQGSATRAEAVTAIINALDLN